MYKYCKTMLLACFLSTTLISVRAYSDCYVWCSVCGLTLWGGPTMATGSELSSLISTAGINVDEITTTYKQLETDIKTQLDTSAFGQVRDTFVKAFDTDIAEEDTDNLFTNPDEEIYLTQEYSLNEDETVVERAMKNVALYNIETKGDYANETSATQRREYMRQQSTISLLAKTQVLKSEFVKLKTMIEKLNERNTAMLTDGMSEAVILNYHIKWRMVWSAVLVYQKKIEAARLEFEAQQALSNMKMVKNTLGITM